MASPSSILRSARSDVLPGSRSYRGSSIQIWPNPVPLDCGIMRTLEKQGSRSHHHDAIRFPANHLKKMLVYARGKGKIAYPTFRFSIWAHIATNKMNMTEEMAWLYFETFDMVSDITSQDRIDLLQLTSKCSSPEALGELRKKLSVDTMQFILFLYLQNSPPRYSLKTSMVSGEQWPSPESELRHRSWEQFHLVFLRAKLLEMLEILQEEEGQLSEEAVAALEFVFSSAVNLEPCNLLAMAISAGVQSGYSKISKKFSPTQFEFWLRSLLIVNPFGPHSLMSHRKELKPVTYFRSDENNDRVLSNGGALLPSPLRCTLLYRVSKQTVAMSEDALRQNRVHIKNCQRSNIYLLAPLRYVYIEKCSKCVLVLGAVSSAVVVTNSDCLTIITACRKIQVSSSSTCVLHLLTVTKPLLLPGSAHITLSPYNTHYPSLQEHIRQCGLLPSVNYWNSPINLAEVGGVNDSSVWAIMPPEVFRPIEVPFDLPGETEEIPCPLPPQYLAVLATKKERTKQWYDLLKRTHLTREQGKQLMTTVRDHFEEWLTFEGHKKELLDLGGQRSSLPLPTNLQSDSNTPVTPQAQT